MPCLCQNNNSNSNSTCNYSKPSLSVDLQKIQDFKNNADQNLNLYLEKNTSQSYLVYLINLYNSAINSDNICIYNNALKQVESVVNSII